MVFLSAIFNNRTCHDLFLFNYYTTKIPEFDFLRLGEKFILTNFMSHEN